MFMGMRIAIASSLSYSLSPFYSSDQPHLYTEQTHRPLQRPNGVASTVVFCMAESTAQLHTCSFVVLMRTKCL